MHAPIRIVANVVNGASVMCIRLHQPPGGFLRFEVPPLINLLLDPLGAPGRSCPRETGQPRDEFTQEAAGFSLKEIIRRFGHAGSTLLPLSGLSAVVAADC